MPVLGVHSFRFSFDAALMSFWESPLRGSLPRFFFHRLLCIYHVTVAHFPFPGETYMKYIFPVNNWKGDGKTWHYLRFIVFFAISVLLVSGVLMAGLYSCNIFWDVPINLLLREWRLHGCQWNKVPKYNSIGPSISLCFMVHGILHINMSIYIYTQSFVVTVYIYICIFHVVLSFLRFYMINKISIFSIPVLSIFLYLTRWNQVPPPRSQVPPASCRRGTGTKEGGEEVLYLGSYFMGVYGYPPMPPLPGSKALLRNYGDFILFVLTPSCRNDPICIE